MHDAVDACSHAVQPQQARSSKTNCKLSYGSLHTIDRIATTGGKRYRIDIGIT